MAIKESDFYSSLWASCDELRGGMDTNQHTELSAIEAYRDKTRNLKQAITHELLTGRTRSL